MQTKNSSLHCFSLGLGKFTVTRCCYINDELSSVACARVDTSATDGVSRATKFCSGVELTVPAARTRAQLGLCVWVAPRLCEAYLPVCVRVYVTGGRELRSYTVVYFSNFWIDSWFDWNGQYSACDFFLCLATSYRPFSKASLRSSVFSTRRLPPTNEPVSGCARGLSKLLPYIAN